MRLIISSISFKCMFTKHKNYLIKGSATVSKLEMEFQTTRVHLSPMTNMELLLLWQTLALIVPIPSSNYTAAKLLQQYTHRLMDTRQPN